LIKSFESAVSELLDNGYVLQREWSFQREKRDYNLFEYEITSVNSAMQMVSIFNSIKF